MIAFIKYPFNISMYFQAFGVLSYRNGEAGIDRDVPELEHGLSLIFGLLTFGISPRGAGEDERGLLVARGRGLRALQVAATVTTSSPGFQ